MFVSFIQNMHVIVYLSKNQIKKFGFSPPCNIAPRAERDSKSSIVPSVPIGKMVNDVTVLTLLSHRHVA